MLTLSLDCVKRLLAWHGLASSEHRATLYTLLCAFGNARFAAPRGAAPDDAQLVEAAKKCFCYFSGQVGWLGGALGGGRGGWGRPAPA